MERELIKVPKQEIDKLRLLPLSDGEKGGYLNDLHIDSYLRLLERRSRHTPGLPNTMCIDSLFLTDLRRRRIDAATRRFRRVNPLLPELLLVPLFIPGKPVGHWALLSVHPEKKQVHAYDSMGYKHPQEMRQLFHALQRYARVNDIPWSPEAWHLQDTSDLGPRQKNGVDCGIFVLWFAELLSRKQPIPHAPFELDTKWWRNHIVETLTNQHLGSVSLQGEIPIDLSGWEWMEEASKGSAPSPSPAMDLNTLMEALGEACDSPIDRKPALQSGEEDWEKVTEDALVGVAEGDLLPPPVVVASPASPCLSVQASEELLEDMDCTATPEQEEATTNTVPDEPHVVTPREEPSTFQPRRWRRRNKKRTIYLPDGTKLRVPRKLLLGY
ncbi:uncharacterized protein LOC129005896 [Macrosteles quadrilineatus]|uniref:uncharacterized protein LOC129005896 n=2 Tax=Macrosteles quadrilineatus TaxID=74068 RepID=UPI0023E10E6F|nr:uncharacterized protein LOC129005896 [Macrosteles quadrilineatus]